LLKNAVWIDVYGFNIALIGAPVGRLFAVKFSVEFAGELAEFRDEAGAPFLPAQPSKLSLRHLITDAPQPLTGLHLATAQS
jgi:hypothetical protein